MQGNKNTDQDASEEPIIVITLGKLMGITYGPG